MATEAIKSNKIPEDSRQQGERIQTSIFSSYLFFWFHNLEEPFHRIIVLLYSYCTLRSIVIIGSFAIGRRHSAKPVVFSVSTGSVVLVLTTSSVLMFFLCA